MHLGTVFLNDVNSTGAKIRSARSAFINQEGARYQQDYSWQQDKINLLTQAKQFPQFRSLLEAPVPMSWGNSNRQLRTGNGQFHSGA
jgi:hypothetical protein